MIDRSPTAIKLRRYAFLTGYTVRNDSEEQEVYRLRSELLAEEIDPGWSIIMNDDLEIHNRYCKV